MEARTAPSAHPRAADAGGGTKQARPVDSGAQRPAGARASGLREPRLARRARSGPVAQGHSALAGLDRELDAMEALGRIGG